jgi:hypothetical protein
MRYSTLSVVIWSFAIFCLAEFGATSIALSMLVFTVMMVGNDIIKEVRWRSKD